MSLHNFNKIPCRKPLTVIKFLPASIHTNVNTNKMAKIVNPRDAAWQEIKSIGAFSAVLVTINELARAAGIQSPTVMMIINVVVLVANMAWQYQDNGGMERYTIDKQMVNTISLPFLQQLSQTLYLTTSTESTGRQCNRFLCGPGNLRNFSGRQGRR